MKFIFKALGQPEKISFQNWHDWKWQFKNIKKSTPKNSFVVGASPYYLRLIECYPVLKPIIYFNQKETQNVIKQEKLKGHQSMIDPLGEEKHSPHPRLIHRYPDRVVFLLTDQCAVYCRYCTRKRFTGKQKAFISKKDQEEVYSYIQNNKGIREVILSGGDPLSLSDSILEHIFKKIRSMEHIEIIRLASRIPVVCPMRLTSSLIHILKKYQPVFLMTHFNHPLELTAEVQKALSFVADNGILMFNQTVLLKGINNHPSILQALMRRLLYLRVKPYYMFQCDPSEGTDHFRTSIQNSQWIQKELWGRFSGLALPNLSVDIPGGGGKVGLTPDFVKKQEEEKWCFKGWDGLQQVYINPPMKNSDHFLKDHPEQYQIEWETLKNQPYGALTDKKKTAKSTIKK